MEKELQKINEIKITEDKDEKEQIKTSEEGILALEHFLKKEIGKEYEKNQNYDFNFFTNLQNFPMEVANKDKESGEGRYSKYKISKDNFQNITFHIVKQLNKGDIYRFKYIKEEERYYAQIKFPFYVYDENRISDEAIIKINKNPDGKSNFYLSIPNKKVIKNFIHSAAVYPPNIVRDYVNLAKQDKLNEEFLSNIHEIHVKRDRTDKIVSTNYYQRHGYEKQADYNKIVPVAEEIYDELIQKYADYYQNIIEPLVKENEKNHKLLKVLENFSQGESNGLIKDYLGLFEQEQRELAYSKRDITLNELKEEVEKKSKEIEQLDKQRYNLHRLIDNFAYKFLFGREKLKIVTDIEAEIMRKAESNVQIIDNIYLRYNKNYYSIELGLGCDAEGCHEQFFADGDYFPEEPAELEEYESFVAEGNLFEEDQKIAGEIIHKINDKYPNIIIENNVIETGTYHYQHRRASIKFDLQSIVKETQETHLSEKQIRDDMIKIIRQIVLNSRKSK